MIGDPSALAAIWVKPCQTMAASRSTHEGTVTSAILAEPASRVERRDQGFIARPKMPVRATVPPEDSSPDYIDVADVSRSVHLGHVPSPLDGGDRRWSPAERPSSTTPRAGR